MKKFVTILFVILWIPLSIMATTKVDPIFVIKNKLLAEFPDLPIEKIKKSKIDDLYEVYAGPIVIYTTADGRYLFHGDVIDLDKQRYNVTEATRRELRLKSLDQDFSEKNMIVFASENVVSTVTVFTDIDCGYCRKLHQEMEEINKLGVKVRYVPFPRGGMNSPSAEKAEAVWCARDRNKAYTEAIHGKEVTSKPCNDPVATGFQLGVAFGVSGTPTIIFEDGSVVPGYMPPALLAEEAKRRKP